MSHDSDVKTRQNQTPKKGVKRKRVWQKKFVERLRQCGCVTTACRKANISRCVAYELRNQDEAFKAEWDEALEEATDSLELAARHRAVDGIAKPVYQGGTNVGVVQEYSDSLLMFLLRAHRPDKFRDNNRDGRPGTAESTLPLSLDKNFQEALERVYGDKNRVETTKTDQSTKPSDKSDHSNVLNGSHH